MKTNEFDINLFHCVRCGEGFYTKKFKMRPPQLNTDGRGYLLDDNGVIIQNINEPEIEVPECDLCGSILL
jgi:hypothetical protein